MGKKPAPLPPLVQLQNRSALLLEGGSRVLVEAGPASTVGALVKVKAQATDEMMIRRGLVNYRVPLSALRRR